MFNILLLHIVIYIGLYVKNNCASVNKWDRSFATLMDVITVYIILCKDKNFFTVYYRSWVENIKSSLNTNIRHKCKQ